jgi:hypothetical protein
MAAPRRVIEISIGATDLIELEANARSRTRLTLVSGGENPRINGAYRSPRRRLEPSGAGGAVDVLALLDRPRLVAQLCGLERRVSRGGKDSIDHAPSPAAHDDVANAVAPTALGFVVLLAAQHALALAAAPIEIVAAENFHGDVAEQIGGADVRGRGHWLSRSRTGVAIRPACPRSRVAARPERSASRT